MSKNSNRESTDQLTSAELIIDKEANNGKSENIKLELLEKSLTGIEATSVFLDNLSYKLKDSIILAPFIQQPWAAGKAIKEFWKATLIEGIEPDEIKTRVQKYKKRNQKDENGKKIPDPKSPYPNATLKEKDEFGNDIWYPVQGAIAYLEDIFELFRNEPAFSTGLTCIPNKMALTGETFTPTANSWYASHSVSFEVDTFTNFESNFNQVKTLSDATGIVPTMVIHSGGKSPHCYLCLEDGEVILDEKIRLELQRRFVILFSSDPSITGANREMRFPGVCRQEKGKEQTIVALNERKYTVNELFELTDKYFPHGLTDIHWGEYLGLRKEIPGNEIGRLLNASLNMCQTSEEEIKPKNPVRTKSDAKIGELLNLANRTDTKIIGSVTAPFEIFLGRKTKDLINSGITQGTVGRDPTALELSLDLQGRELTLDRLGIPYTNDAYSLVGLFCDNCTPPIPEALDKCWNNASKYAGEHPTIDDNFFLSRYSQWLEKNAPEEHEKVFADVEIPTSNNSNNWQQKETERQEILHTLAVYENDINIEIEGEYCADEISAIAPSYGNLFIKLPMGMGKTQAAKHLINVDYPDRAVVAIFPTTALGRSTCKDLGITYWQDIQDECKRDRREYDLNKRLRECHRLGITYDSLWRIADKENKDLILIIDEGEKGYSHLLNSSTVNKNRNRPFCINALFNLGKNQDEQGVLALVMDANLTAIAKDLTLSFLCSEVNVNITTKKIFPKFPCKILTSLEKGKTAKLLATHTHNTFEAVRQGKFIIIPTDNKDDGIGIEKELKKEFKDINIWRFDSSNSGSDEGKQFAGNIDYFLAKNKVQVFIYSPSMGQGLSSIITKEYAEAVQKGVGEEELTEVATQWKNLTPYFDEEYAYNYHLDNFEFQQMLGRYRLLIMRNIWVDSKVIYDGCSSTDPSVIVRNMRESRETAFTIEAEAIKRVKDKGIEVDDLSIAEKEIELLKAIKEGNIPPYIWAMCRQQARRNWQIKNRRENLINWLTKCGHEVDSQPIETDNVNESDRTKVDKAKKETNAEFAKLAIQALESQGLLTDIEIEEWGQREHLDPVTEQPRYSISTFNRRYPGAILGIEKHERVDFFNNIVASGKEFWLKAITNGWMYQHRNEILWSDLQDNKQLQKAFNFCGIYSARDFKRRTALHSFISKLGLFDLIKFEEAELPKGDAPQYTWDCPVMKELAKRLMSKAGVKGCRIYFNKQPLTDPKKVVTYANDLYNHFGFSLACGQKTETSRAYVLRWLDEKKFPEKYRKVIFQSLEFKNLEPLQCKGKVLAVDLFSCIELEKIYCQENNVLLEDNQETSQVAQNTQLELPLHTFP